MNPKYFFPKPDDTDYVRHGSFDRVPDNVSHLTASPGQQSHLSHIGFKWHAGSQHLSIENFQPPNYYEDYLMTATYSKKMQALQLAQIEKLVGLHEDSSMAVRSFVEIGCGDGSLLKHAQQHIRRVLGIEPSRRFAAEAARQGIEVLIGYVGSEAPLTTEKFDSFASRQVFEHLPNPLDVLIGIRKMLLPGAVGLIEVPNGHRALRLNRFFEFFPDHVNYYSVNSLVALASDAGFNVISCEETFGGDYLELWLRNEPDITSRLGEMMTHREHVCAELTKMVMDLSCQGKRVAIWGCGAKTLTILAASPSCLSENIVGIIDSDPHKHGRYVPNTSVRVCAPAQGFELRPDVVFVLALSYRDEIALATRQWIPACESVLTLDDYGKIVEL